MQIELSLQSYALFVGNFARSRPARHPTPAIPGATLPEKNAGFRARECSSVGSHASELALASTSPTRELFLLTNYVVDMMTRLPLHIRPYVRSFRIKLPLNKSMSINQ